MKLIAGLGNPGAAYIGTPHNVGFDVVELLAVRFEAPWRNSSRFQALLTRIQHPQETLLLAKPQTFMNLSGSSVAPMLRYHNATPSDLIVVVDDVDLPLGMLRIRPAGGSGGHRGVASVIEALGTEKFTRVRIGVGRDGNGNLVDHVLQKFASEQIKLVREAVEAAADAIECLVDKGLSEAMNRFNGWNAIGAPSQDRK